MSEEMDSRSTATPLAGIQVVELGGSVAAPYGSWILARLGASVLKVERPEAGDDSRAWSTARHSGFSAVFAALNSGKKSAAVDLEDSRQRDALHRYIIEKVDVVVQNLRPGVVESFGLGAEQLLSEKPELIYCNVSAYGDQGPLAGKPGYDPLMQAFTGLMSVTGEPDSPPVRVGTSIVDMGTGMWCAIGVLGALQNRVRTGRGGRVDASLFETGLGWMTLHSSKYFGIGRIAERTGSATESIAPYQAYRCKDGYLVIAAGNNRLFAKLSEALGHGEWSDDKRFETNEQRTKNTQDLNAQIEAVTTTAPRSEWQKRLDEVGVPNVVIQNIAEAVTHAQSEATGIIQRTDDGNFSLIGLPLMFDGVRPPQPLGPPQLGEYTEQLFASAAAEENGAARREKSNRLVNVDQGE